MNITRKVISASRRIDMVANYPNQLVEVLWHRCPPERVHTLVLWTKNAHNLFRHSELTSQVKQYDQIYLHFSITGMGQTVFEPKVPSSEISLSYLPDVIKLVQNPLRVRIRYDPIVHLKMPDGSVYNNLGGFEMVACQIAKLGIRDVSISWMQRYKKVDDRLRRHGIDPVNLNFDQWQEEAEWLESIAKEHGLVLHGCCVPGWPNSRCIDGELLNALHPKGFVCSTKRAKEQRQDCGCTESWDIGWYQKCAHGCIYCYGNPREYTVQETHFF